MDKNLKPRPEFYLKLLENISDGVYFVDTERRIIYWNKTAEKISGFSKDEVVGHFCHDNILNHVTEKGVNLCTSTCPLHLTLQDGQPRQTELYLHHKNGHRLPVLIRVNPIRDENGQIIGAVETFTENSQQMEARRRVHELQRTVLLDPLTGIGNRRHIDKRLSAALLSYQQLGIPFGIAMVDIDLFKRVNDAFGHDIGDKMLRIVAQTLRKNLRANDTVGRWGGEEFLAILTDVNYQSLRAAAEKLRIMVEESRLRMDRFELGVTVSIGATLAKINDTPETLVKRADQLLYHSKRQGRNRVTIG